MVYEVQRRVAENMEMRIIISSFLLSFFRALSKVWELHNNGPRYKHGCGHPVGSGEGLQMIS